MSAPDSTRIAHPLPLAEGIRSRHVEDVNGLRMHILEAGHSGPKRPCVLLLHGFPERASSGRKLMPPLGAAGHHVVAPDQRGYGQTRGWDGSWDGDLSAFRMFNLVRDALGLVHAIGRREVAGVVGHDFGSPVAAWCALLRPDVFRSLALMSAPFAGPPAIPVRSARGRSPSPAASPPSPSEALRRLDTLPRPRKHYQWYYSTRGADTDMRHCPQGIHAFLRAYYHVKSADWPQNAPHPLAGWTAEALAEMPTYYIMDRDADMAQTVAPHMPSRAAVAACRWLPDEQLRVYSDSFARTGFQGGLQWYRCATSGRFDAEMQLFSGRTIDVPSCFIAGRADWGVYQRPGDFETMQQRALTRLHGCHLVDGAGHWVQQEQPRGHARLLLAVSGSALSRMPDAACDAPCAARLPTIGLDTPQDHQP